MSVCFEIKKCEVCGSTDLTQVLDLGSHPMCDDLIPIDSNDECKTFPINILYCNQCYTAHQKYQVPKLKLFPKTYHYRSRFTADVLSGMDALVDSVQTNLGSLSGLTVLDVGCNDGSLLDKFSKRGATTIGVEPTGAYADAGGRGHIILNDFLSEATARKILCAHPRIDVITFTNVFAHIENLPELLKILSVLISDKTILVIENHYLGSVLEKNQFDTFYHEHPRTYSLNSFIHIARELGREVNAVEFPKRYGGNVRVIIGKGGLSSPRVTSLLNKTLEREQGYLNQFNQMDSFISCWQKSKKNQLVKLVRENGRLIAKAFPGRAAILIKLLDLTSNELECVYEKPKSLKIGYYLPGTRIPIRSDEELFKNINKQKNIVNLAWHIPLEINCYLRENGFCGNLINIID
jgi:SAM-dependent methyltransferase